MAGWTKVPLGMEVGVGPGDFVLDGDPAPLLKRDWAPIVVVKQFTFAISSPGEFLVGLLSRPKRSSAGGAYRFAAIIRWFVDGPGIGKDNSLNSLAIYSCLVLARSYVVLVVLALLTSLLTGAVGVSKVID